MLTPPQTPTPPPKENFFINIACNVLIPGVLLSKAADWIPALKPGLVLVVALAFPAGYFLFDYAKRRVANAISIFGFVGTLVSGVIGLMQLDPFWFAVKEAAFPAVLGASLYITQVMRRPLVKAFVWNDAVLHTERIDAAVAEHQATGRVEALFAQTTHLLAPAFFASAVAHFVLARWLVTAHPETAAQLFNEQLGRFNLIAWPAIILPSFAYLVWLMLRFMKQLRGILGLTEDELYRA